MQTSEQWLSEEEGDTGKMKKVKRIKYMVMEQD